ncbi:MULTISPECIES: hypothetical protein [Thermococcus]|uniref:Uncharacterized protein n=1 Tax=Thermococcus barossii TaxID=54077 RepID=A0A2Z2MER1_9EURY|nr:MULTISPECIES: hypothetical protein [Thermococcus]ASJ05120.1 hypothetical protein A3L01_06970 [Thermococcus barossii]NJE02284.1 hypothetical protein [Thermococcus sp. JdF3]
MKARTVAGGLAYLLGIGLSLVRPPIERLACVEVPSGRVCTGVNTPLLLIELGLVVVGALLLGLDHGFKNDHELNGWLGVAIGLGTAFIGGYSGIWVVFLFGVALATLGLLVYKVGRVKHDHG